MEEKAIELFNGRENGGYLMLKGELPFAKRVNEILGNYWVSTGRELNLENVMLEVLAEDYNKRLTPSS